jgi:cellulose synthase operon protein YhjQ
VGEVALAVSEDTPDDVATLYSWANLRGAKYRDFSAVRAQAREQARKRVQESMEIERLRAEQAAFAPAQIPVDPALESDAAVIPSAAAQPVVESISARWFALNSIFLSGSAEPARERARIPALAVFSLAGGVGKTSLVAALGRALSSHGERVLLVDTAAFGMLPFYFGARDQRHGVLRTFVAPDARGESRIEVLALDIDRFGQEANAPEPFTQEILRHAGNSGRILIDLATASGVVVRRILRMSPTVLVPVLPDIGSVASVGAIERFFQRNPSGTGQAVAPYYVLNQFDEDQRLHRDVRNVLRSQLGERLLPFELCRTSAVSESLAEGMTVMDYAPDSPLTDQYARLAGWVRNLVAPSERAWRSTRWSEG